MQASDGWYWKWLAKFIYIYLHPTCRLVMVGTGNGWLNMYIYLHPTCRLVMAGTGNGWLNGEEKEKKQE